MTARPMTTESALRHRNVTPEAMLRHVRVVTKDNTVQLWMGGTHIANVEPDSIPAIALQSFAADQPLALARSSSSAERGMREALEGFVAKIDPAILVERDLPMSPLADELRAALAALSARAGEDEQARLDGLAPISTDTKGTSK